jgi:predicted phosphohydrolase
LPGKKIIGKGNHDYWWQTQKKLAEYCRDAGVKTLSFLYNNAYACENLIVCGSRGWFVDTGYSDQDAKIVKRESMRLELSLTEAEKLLAARPDSEIVAFLHYPPACNGVVCEPIAEVLNRHAVRRCFFGHLHSVNPSILDRSVGCTALYCVSADYIGFKPMKIN